jgi:1,2-diacylglycerol 3-beta-galactosyltransferase
MGHRAAAQAVIKEFQHQLGDLFTYDLIDLMKSSRIPLLQDFPVFYNKIVQNRYLLKLFNMVFLFTRFRIGFFIFTIGFRVIVFFAKHKIRRIFRNENPDLVVNVNAYTNVVVQWTRVREIFGFKYCNLISDLTNINYTWVVGRHDLCIAPNAMAMEDLRRYHAPNRAMLGYPLDRKFLNVQNKEPEPGDRRVRVLIFVRNIRTTLALVEALKSAKDSLRITVICGTNEDVKEILEKRYDFMRIIGYTASVQDYMADSDVVISKAGPGVIMEAVYLKKLLILTHFLGYQEKLNVDFVVNNGFGHFCPDENDILEIILKLYAERHIPPTDGFNDRYNTSLMVERMIALVPEKAR